MPWLQSVAVCWGWRCESVSSGCPVEGRRFCGGAAHGGCGVFVAWGGSPDCVVGWIREAWPAQPQEEKAMTCELFSLILAVLIVALLVCPKDGRHD